MRRRSGLGSLVWIALVPSACNDPSPGDGGGSGGGASEGSTSSGPGTTSVVDGTSSGTTSSGTTGIETTGPPPVECVELEWELIHEAREPSRALAVAVGDRVVVLERRSEDPVRLYLHGMGLDGSASFGPVLVGNANDGDVALLPGGDAVVVASGFQTSWMSWWSAAGEALDEVDVLGQGQPLSKLAVVALPDGSTFVGGTVEARAKVLQVVLQRRSAAGDVAWELPGEHDEALALAPAPELGLHALVANRFVEGFDSFVLTYDADGSVQWSAMAGSEGGNFNLSVAPYALAADGEGGAIVMGSQAPPSPDPLHASRLIRYTGGVARVGERIVAILGSDHPTLSVHDLDGVLLCQQQLGDDEASIEVNAVRPLVGGGFVAAGSLEVGASVRAWVARFAAPG